MSIGSIQFYRGDSYPISLTIKDASSGEAIDISGYSFILTVDETKNPTDDSTKVFSVDGVVDADQTTNPGKVTFTPTTVNTSIAPQKYYYDVQMTDGDGNIRTIEKNTWFIEQDITK
jgi:hypothetical protein